MKNAWLPGATGSQAVEVLRANTTFSADIVTHAKDKRKEEKEHERSENA